MEQRLYEALQRNPIIAAVRDDEGLAQCLRTDIQTVFVLYGDICNIPEIVRQIKDAGKIAIVHADLISGLAAKEISVDFLRRSTQADGVISTRANMIQRAKENECIVDATQGRRTKSVIVTDSDHIVLSALQPETLAGRFQGSEK